MVGKCTQCGEFNLVNTYSTCIKCWMKERSKDNLTKKEKEVYKIANNVLYFNDNSDYQTALYEILKVLNPKLEDYPKLKFIE